LTGGSVLAIDFDLVVGTNDFLSRGGNLCAAIQVCPCVDIPSSVNFFSFRLQALFANFIKKTGNTKRKNMSHCTVIAIDNT
jgi:hypothetical protein